MQVITLWSGSRITAFCLKYCSFIGLGSSPAGTVALQCARDAGTRGEIAYFIVRNKVGIKKLTTFQPCTELKTHHLKHPKSPPNQLPICSSISGIDKAESCRHNYLSTVQLLHPWFLVDRRPEELAVPMHRSLTERSYCRDTHNKANRLSRTNRWWGEKQWAAVFFCMSWVSYAAPSNFIRVTRCHYCEKQLNILLLQYY